MIKINPLKLCIDCVHFTRTSLIPRDICTRDNKLIGIELVRGAKVYTNIFYYAKDERAFGLCGKSGNFFQPIDKV